MFRVLEFPNIYSIFLILGSILESRNNFQIFFRIFWIFQIPNFCSELEYYINVLLLILFLIIYKNYLQWGFSQNPPNPSIIFGENFTHPWLGNYICLLIHRFFIKYSFTVLFFTVFILESSIFHPVLFQRFSQY